MTNENLVSGLGGPADYGEIVVPRGDDNYMNVDLSSIFPGGLVIDGNTIEANSVYVGTNGHVYFGGAPSWNSVSFRPYYADLDTRTDGTNADSGQIYVDLDTENSTATFTWDQVGRYYTNGNPPLSFQMQLASVGGSDLKITFRYGDMEIDSDYLWYTIGANLGSLSFETGLENIAAPIDYDTTIGNTGLPGIWEYTLSLLPFTGTHENDVLAGTDGDEVIVGLAGDDQIDGYGGGDSLFGGDGNDTISGGAGNDDITGDAGDDDIAGGFGNDDIDGGDGFDLMFGNEGTDTMKGGLGNDHMYGGTGRDVMRGNEGNDTMSGGGGADEMSGNQGHDTMSGGGGDDIMDGNRGRDTLFGEGGRDTLNGGIGDDALYGGADHDHLIGGRGDDGLYGGDGDDRLYGNDGNDVLSGESGDDFMNGGSGEDTFMFDSGADVIGSFDLGRDRVMIDLDLVGGVAASVGELWSMATVDGTDTVFDFGNDDTLTFQGISAPAVLAGLIEFF